MITPAHMTAADRLFSLHAMVLSRIPAGEHLADEFRALTHPARLGPAHRTVLSLCQAPTPVIEIAIQLAGVLFPGTADPSSSTASTPGLTVLTTRTRDLLDDLATAGLVQIDEPDLAAAADPGSDLTLSDTHFYAALITRLQALT